jgi:hypothetical protein
MSDKYLTGLVQDIFTRHGVTEASIATLPTIVADLAYLVERVSTETTEMAIANLTDPACPASIVKDRTYNLVIGFTESDRASGYVSFCDGYRPGAKQRLVSLTVRSARTYLGEEVAEAAFVATNHPEPDTLGGLAGIIAKALAYKPVRSLSVGDTVDVNGTNWACSRKGWVQV